jgi:hypothetical protein
MRLVHWLFGTPRSHRRFCWEEACGAVFALFVYLAVPLGILWLFWLCPWLLPPFMR